MSCILTFIQMRNSPVTVGEPARPLEITKVFTRLVPSKAERVCSLRLISIQRSLTSRPCGSTRLNFSMANSNSGSSVGVGLGTWVGGKVGVLVGVLLGSGVRVANGV